jgi:hypothetical protein
LGTQWALPPCEKGSPGAIEPANRLSYPEKIYQAGRIAGFWRCCHEMSGRTPINPVNQVKVHSRSSFLWNAAKMAAVRSWNHFGTLVLIGSLLQAGLLVRYVSKLLQGVDVNFWITLSPVIAAAVLFFILWLMSAHKIYEQSLKPEKSNDDEIFTIKDKPKSFALLVLAIIIILACSFAVLVIQHSQIAQLKSQLPQFSIAKPLPDEIIPRPEQPSLPPYHQLSFLETPIVTITNAQRVFFKADISANGNAVATIDKRMADLQAQEDKRAAQQAANIEFEKQQKLLEIPRDWRHGLDHYRRLLVMLQDDMSEKAKGIGDTIVPSPGYSRCMPLDIDPETGEIKAATIGLLNNTNVNFQIIITGLNSEGHRQVYVFCAAGSLELYPGTNDDFNAILNTYLGLPSPNYTTIDNADALVSDNLTSLIAAQYMLLGRTNKK